MSSHLVSFTPSGIFRREVSLSKAGVVPSLHDGGKVITYVSKSGFGYRGDKVLEHFRTCIL